MFADSDVVGENMLQDRASQFILQYITRHSEECVCWLYAYCDGDCIRGSEI